MALRALSTRREQYCTIKMMMVTMPHSPSDSVTESVSTVTVPVAFHLTRMYGLAALA